MRRQLKRAVPLILLAAIVLVGATPFQRGTQEDRVTALETRLAGVEAAQESVLRHIDQMRLDLDNTLEPLRVRLADYGEEMRGISSRLVALEEQLALMTERLIDIAGSLSRGATAGAPRRSGGTPMPPPQRPTGVPGPRVAGPVPRIPPDSGIARSEADSLYSSAYTDYLSANYPLAVSGFEEYLRLFPESGLAANARYWIGESYFSRQQYQLARTAFLEVARRYPRAETVPDAKFKAARCLIELGDGSRAIDELVQLVRQHPRSGTVPIACMQIERLGAEKPLGCRRN